MMSAQLPLATALLVLEVSEICEAVLRSIMRIHILRTFLLCSIATLGQSAQPTVPQVVDFPSGKLHLKGHF